MIYEITKAFCYWLCKIFFKMEVYGIDVFPDKGPFMLACNHISNIDPFAAGCACPRRLYFIAKEELFHNKFLGAYLRKLNCISIKRTNTEIGTLRLALKVLEKYPLFLFPQGTRTEDYSSPKAGIGLLYKKAGVPIIAAHIHGTDTILPRGAKFFKRGKIKVVYARVTDIDVNDTKEHIALKIMEKIKSL